MTGPAGRSRTAGDWQTVSGWLPLSEITRGEEVLAFDPPNVVFLAGGERFRVLGYDEPRPTLEVERIGGEVSRYTLATSADASPVGGES